MGCFQDKELGDWDLAMVKWGSVCLHWRLRVGNIRTSFKDVRMTGLGQRSPEGPPKSQPSGAMLFNRTFCHDGKFLRLCHVEQIATWA